MDFFLKSHKSLKLKNKKRKERINVPDCNRGKKNKPLDHPFRIIIIIMLVI